MSDDLHPALLPAGLRDILPPDAGIEAATVARLMAVLARNGYDRVKPPLVEFEAIEFKNTELCRLRQLAFVRLPSPVKLIVGIMQLTEH